MVRRHFGMSYQDWKDEPAWYVELLLDQLHAEAPGTETGAGEAPPDTLAEWR